MPPKSDNASSDAKQENDQQPFRLLDLPPELWVKIGKYAIDDAPKVTGETFLSDSRFEFSDWASAKEARAALIQPAITKTCQVMRNELLPYYYQARFYVVLDTFDDYFTYDVFAEWLKSGCSRYLRHVQGKLTVEAAQSSSEKGWMEFRMRQWGVLVQLEETGRCWAKDWSRWFEPMPMVEYRVKLR